VGSARGDQGERTGAGAPPVTALGDVRLPLVSLDEEEKTELGSILRTMKIV